MQQPPAPAPAKPKPVPVPPAQVDPKYGSAEAIMQLPAPRLIAILEDPVASVYAKAKACQQLAIVGEASAVPALGRLLTDAQLSHYARVALEQIPGPAPDDALRAALATTQSLLLAGVITSLGQRRDSKSISQLARLRTHADPEIARAADAALARIRPVP